METVSRGGWLTESEDASMHRLYDGHRENPSPQSRGSFSMFSQYLFYLLVGSVGDAKLYP